MSLSYKTFLISLFFCLARLRFPRGESYAKPSKLFKGLLKAKPFKGF
jgi:hypothetical protein